MTELHPSEPRRIGSYRLLRRLGSGGMGQVFLGESPGGRLVAVKVIRPELADGPDFRRRFAREVTAARRVSGMFTAPVVDADPEAPRPWLVTAYVDGPSLADFVRQAGAMPESDVIRLGLALAEGLSAIHAVGIVHRDLKPANVLLASDGPRIIDFGISRAAESTSLTQTGLIVGSPGFMSPEQAAGREVSTPSDVFSLAAVLAFAATGAEPFGSGDATALLYRVVHAEATLTGVSDGLRNVLEACLVKNPAARPTTGALLALLSSLSPGQFQPGTDVGSSTAPAHPGLAGDPPAQPTVSRTGSPGAAAPESRPPQRATTLSLPLAPSAPPRRRRAWIALCAAIVLVAGGGVALASHGFTTPNSPRAGTPGSTHSPSGATHSSTAEPKPRAVIESYFAAINAHDWRRVWYLGGKNLSSSYAAMVAGFHETSRDVITHIVATGDTVTVHVRAYETAGRVQVFLDSYTVSGDVIAGGSQTLISTRTVRAAVTGATSPGSNAGGPSP